ncbi:MAG: hypothetical protein OEV89_07375 [Desulfobulbaceae bacterium]|nr:hypothetical protein [Desulfobulbaceae bacterium]HIJ90573.1 hypothetical protein [Deltaproteobacteria bacterium]
MSKIVFDPSCLNENNPGRFTSASLEYSSMVMAALMERGGITLRQGPVTFGKASFGTDSQAIKNGAREMLSSLQILGGSAKKLFTPFSWTARQVARVGNRGLPVHLDSDSLGAIRVGLARIEERLARIEERGISISRGFEHPGADDFKEKPSQEKNMLMRAILEDSKGMLKDSAE